MRDKSSVAIGLVVVLGITIVGIVVGEIMERPVADLSLVATAIAGGLIGWLAPHPPRDKTTEAVVVEDEPVEVLPLTGPSLGAKVDQTPPIHPPTTGEQVDLDQLWNRLSR